MHVRIMNDDSSIADIALHRNSEAERRIGRIGCLI